MSQVSSDLPVHIRSPLLHHGLLTLQDLLRVEDVEEVNGHEERHGHILPHGVGHLIFWVNDCVLTGGGKSLFNLIKNRFK